MEIQLVIEEDYRSVSVVTDIPVRDRAPVKPVEVLGRATVKLSEEAAVQLALKLANAANRTLVVRGPLRLRPDEDPT